MREPTVTAPSVGLAAPVPYFEAPSFVLRKIADGDFEVHSSLDATFRRDYAAILLKERGE